MGNSSGISVYIFFKVIVKLDVDAGRFVAELTTFVGRFTKRLWSKAGLYPKEERKIQKKQWDEDHKRISVARDVRESWKNIKCMCVYSSDTAFA